jgi:hypothetical protein
MIPVAMELNRRLAQLLGWTEIVDVGGAWLGRPPGGSQKSRDQAKVPDWCGDWAACGPLLSHCVVAGATSPSVDDCDFMQDRQDSGDDAALRRVIVAATISKLEVRR